MRARVLLDDGRHLAIVGVTEFNGVRWFISTLGQRIHHSKVISFVAITETEKQS